MRSPRLLLLVVLGAAACAPRAGAATGVMTVALPPFVDAPTSDFASEDEAGAEDGEPEVEPPLRTVGTWSGVGRQDDGQTWDIVLRVHGASAKPCAEVEYPPHDDWNVHCKGEWRCEAPSGPHRLVGVEHIVEGQGRCIEGCKFDMNLRLGHVRFDCSHVGVMADADLQRSP